MKKDQNRSDRPSQDSTERDAGRGLEGAIGGALSRVFERAGIDVRVVPTDEAPAPSSPPQTGASEAEGAPAAAPAPAAPAARSPYEALVAVAALAIGRQLLATAQPAAEAPSQPAAQCDRLSDLLSSEGLSDLGDALPSQPLAPVAGRAVATGGPARPAAGRVAEARPSARPAPGPRRNVTIRY